MISLNRLNTQRLLTFLHASLLSLTLVTLSFWLQGNVSRDKADEGFLWYGTIQTASGEVPSRDFQSYDPGRYYWGAAWFKILGDEGLLSLRISCAMFQALGITFALLALRRAVQSWWGLALTGIVFVLWLPLYHRVFEYSFSMATLYFCVLLMEKPSVGRHFIGGLFVGLAAFFGRNLGLYSFVSFLLLIGFIRLRTNREQFPKRELAWFGGILVGSSPLLLMLVLVPGFAESLIGSIADLVTRRSTNLPLPIPWPWLQSRYSFSTSVLFLIFPLFVFGTLTYLLLVDGRALKGKELLTASAFVSLPFMHYAFSRADLEHLSGCIPPLLIGLMSLPQLFPFQCRKLLTLVWLPVISIASSWGAAKHSPYYIVRAAGPMYVQKSIDQHVFWVRQDIARSIDAVTYISNNFVAPNEGILFAPYGTFYYGIVKRKSPLRDVYFLWNQTEARQQEMLSDLRKKNVNWIVLGDNDPSMALDGKEELRFKTTHPLLWKHIMEEFDIVEFNGGLSHDEKLMHRKPVRSEYEAAP